MIKENVSVQSSCCNSFKKLDCCYSNKGEPFGCVHPSEKGNSTKQPAEKTHRSTLTPTSQTLTKYYKSILRDYPRDPL